MLKRVVSICLAAVLLMGAVVSVSNTVSAEYENTHVNTGNQRADIIAVAVTQLGYAEEAGGYSKYGDYHGNPYADWCGYFVSWCARQANVPTSVLKKQGWAAADKWGLPTFTASEKLPQPGDLYFRGSAHCGLVYYVSGEYFYTLEGNSVGDKVISRALSLYSSSYTFASPNYGGSNNYNHTHSMETKHESTHPHKEYQKCSGCDYSKYTGNTKIVDECIDCIQMCCSHTYSAWESTGDSKHQKTCPKCQKVESAKHGWQDVKTLKEPSCKEAGSKTQSCSTCGATRTVTIDKTNNHDYDAWKYYTSRYHSRVCSVCEKVDTQAHNVDQEEWETDEEKHWHECVDCGEMYDEKKHTFAEGCVAPCADCQYVRPEGHDYSQQWQYDDKEHWQVCVNCGESTMSKQHTFDNDCDGDCNVCGFERSADHVYGEDMITGAEGHWYECDICGHKSGHTNHTPGAQATEESAQYCTDCGYEMEPMLIHEHTYTYSSDGNTHWGSCECGYEMEPVNHAWDLATGQCSVCQVVSVQETESQNWDFVWLIMAGAVVTTTAVTTAVMIHKRKKRRAAQMM